MSKTHSNVSRMTLGQLVSRMPIGQLWGLLVIAAGLLGGAFGLGYQLGGSLAEVTTVQSRAEVGRLNTENDRLQEQLSGLKTKEKFLALYLQYLLAKEQFEQAETAENRQRMEAVEDAFSTYVANNLAENIVKGATPEEATVTFDDGTPWPVPPEFLPGLMGVETQ